MRRITADEMSELYGSPSDLARIDTWDLPHFVIVADLDEPKYFGEGHSGPSASREQLNRTIERCILGLRTFQSGSVSASELQFRQLRFAPIGVISTSFGLSLLNPPLGAYMLRREDVDLFRSHLERLYKPLPSAMELACTRLGYAEARQSAVDKGIDATIWFRGATLCVDAKGTRRDSV